MYKSDRGKCSLISPLVSCLAHREHLLKSENCVQVYNDEQISSYTLASHIEFHTPFETKIYFLSSSLSPLDTTSDMKPILKYNVSLILTVIKATQDNRSMDGWI